MNTNPSVGRDRAAERHASLSRRRFLRGLGACLALPPLESLWSTGLQAATAAATPLGTSAAAAPVRMAFVYFPNGALPGNWWPTGAGTDFQLNRTMEPLEPLKQHLQVLGGLDHVNATAGFDGPGDHARASGTFLTGVRVRKTAGADIHAGVSIDQLAAKQVGHLTRLPSLELTCDGVRKSGSCDSGYSCAYQFNLSWRTPTMPLSPEPNPRLVFERLFGAGAPGERQKNLALRREQQRSVLDFVLDDSRTLQRQLGQRDQQKLDQYLTSVREVEQQIQRAEQFPVPDPAVDSPAGIPASFEEHIRAMYSMLVLAFQTDSTRIGTFLLANDGSNRAFPEIGIPEGHHYLSHHQGNEEMMSRVGEIDLWYMRQFAWFLDKMKSTQDADGNSLLHNSMIVYGCGNGDGNRHTHVNLPVVLAGGGGGRLTPGRFVKFPSQPMSNLLLSLADRAGVAGVDQFGDSTGALEDI